MTAHPWLAVQHVSWEGPGLLASEALRRGIALVVRRTDLGEPLPRADEIGGLIVMGGPMGALDDGDHPHLAAERSLLAEAVRGGIPVLGVCLGAQLLAAALGAAVRRGPAPEIGFGDVEITPLGSHDPVLGGEQAVPVFHWHQDTFDLPAGAAHLARSSAYAHQAFRAGALAYGFQFHVEVDADLGRAWPPRLPPGVWDETRRTRVEDAGRRIIGRFFDLALT